MTANIPDVKDVQKLAQQAQYTKALVVAWKGIATAQTKADKLSQYLLLAIITATSGRDQLNAIMALISDRNNKVIATSDNEITELDVELARASNGDVFEHEQIKGIVTRIELSNKHNLLVVSPAQMNEAMCTTLTKEFHNLHLDKQKARYKYLKVLLVMALIGASMFIPVRDWVSATAIAEGEQTSVIAAPISGEIMWLVDTGSFVSASDPIVRFDTTEIQTEIDKTTSEIRELELKIAAQGALPQENVASLDENKNSAEIIKARLEELIEQSVIKARIDGVIQWRDSRTGSFADKGEPLGEMTAIEQTLVIARVDVRDWIELPKESSAVFVTSTGSRIAATLEQLPVSVTTGEGEPYYRIGLRLNIPVAAGESGLVKINGKTKALGLILFKRPLQRLKAHISQSIFERLAP